MSRRREFFADASRHTPLLAVDSGGCRYLVATWDVKVGRSLFANRRRAEMVALRKAIDVASASSGAAGWEGGTFLDVGANIGTTTIAALASGRFAAVIALEPELENVRLLRANAALNGFEREVKVLPVAASDREGIAHLRMSVKNSGGHSVAIEDPGESTARAIQVVRLDHLVERGVIDPDRVGMVWVDAQGHEGHVVRGAQSLVRRGIPVVLEFAPAQLAASSRLETLLDDAREHYTHFVDLRTAALGAIRRSEVLRPVGELTRLVDALDAQDRVFTDIQLLRVPRRSASRRLA